MSLLDELIEIEGRVDHLDMVGEPEAVREAVAALKDAVREAVKVAGLVEDLGSVEFHMRPVAVCVQTIKAVPSLSPATHRQLLKKVVDAFREASEAAAKALENFDERED